MTDDLDVTLGEEPLGRIAVAGPAGPGVPTGGTEGQVLAKASATNFDTEWVDAAAGGTMGAQDADDVAITGGTAAFDYGGLKTEDISGGQWLTLRSLEHLTADRILDISVSDGDKELTITANASLGGTNTGDQTTIVGISSTKTQFDQACSNGNFVFVGDIVPVSDGGTGASTASGARTSLGLGTIATQSANDVAITGGTLAGVSVVATNAGMGVVDGLGSFNLHFGYSDGAATAHRTITFNVADGSRSVTLAGNLTLGASFATAGANSCTLTTTGATNVTLPTSGTLANNARSAGFALVF